MKTTKKSIDSLKSQEVNVKKVKGGTSAKATRSPNPSNDSLVSVQGKLKGRIGVTGGSTSISHTNNSGSL